MEPSKIQKALPKFILIDLDFEMKFKWHWEGNEEEFALILSFHFQPCSKGYNWLCCSIERSLATVFCFFLFICDNH